MGRFSFRFTGVAAIALLVAPAGAPASVSSEDALIRGRIQSYFTVPETPAHLDVGKIVIAGNFAVAEFRAVTGPYGKDGTGQTAHGELLLRRYGFGWQAVNDANGALPDCAYAHAGVPTSVVTALRAGASALAPDPSCPTYEHSKPADLDQSEVDESAIQRLEVRSRPAFGAQVYLDPPYAIVQSWNEAVEGIDAFEKVDGSWKQILTMGGMIDQCVLAGEAHVPFDRATELLRAGFPDSAPEKPSDCRKPAASH